VAVGEMVGYSSENAGMAAKRAAKNANICFIFILVQL
jgi:hypothetical protein